MDWHPVKGASHDTQGAKEAHDAAPLLAHAVMVCSDLHTLRATNPGGVSGVFHSTVQSTALLEEGTFERTPSMYGPETFNII